MDCVPTIRDYGRMPAILRIVPKRHAIRRFACILGAVAAIAIGASQAFALGADYSPQALRQRAGSIGGQTPVHGYWVNWEDVFFYAGDAKAFNQFIEAYGSLERCKHKVVIHPGSKLASSPWDKAARDIAVDWSLYVWNTGQAARLAHPGSNARSLCC